MKKIKNSLRKGFTVSKDLKANHIITKNDIMFTRNSSYYSSNDLNKIIGKN